MPACCWRRAAVSASSAGGGRAADDLPCHPDLASALDRETPDYIVVSNETAVHRETLDELARLGFDGRVLVEKPLFAEPAPVPEHRFAHCAVGYNLRFHAVLLALRDAVAAERIVSVHAYCGQYLPDWRPHTDWRASYSADRARGGGVLRDLSHELDYLMWMFGDWSRVAATPGDTGALGIDADDCRCLLVRFERCEAATVQLNYLDRPGRREIIVNGGEHTWRADLGACVLERDGVGTVFSVDRNDSYRAMHRAMLFGRLRPALHVRGGRAGDGLHRSDRVGRRVAKLGAGGMKEAVHHMRPRRIEECQGQEPAAAGRATSRCTQHTSGEGSRTVRRRCRQQRFRSAAPRRRKRRGRMFWSGGRTYWPRTRHRSCRPSHTAFGKWKGGSIADARSLSTSTRPHRFACRKTSQVR